MSDFLTRLIDRALDRGPRLDRRMPALFEPAPAAPGLREESVEIERVAAARAAAADSREPAPAPARRAGKERPPVTPVTGSRAIHDAPGTSQPASPSVADRTIALPPAAVPGPPVTRVETDIHHHHETVVERTERLHTIERHETVREPGVIERTTIVERARPVAASIGSPVRPDATLVTPPAARRVLQDADARQRAQKESTARGPEAPAPSAARQLRRAGPVVEPAAPAVTVTIGRVDIHAAPSAKAAPAARDRTVAAPRMSLEEYLRRRGGGAP